MMILEFLKKILLFPCTWFWEKVQKYKEENAILKMMALFVFSLTGLFVLAMAFVLLMELLINIASEHSGILFVVLVVIWLYLYAKSRMNKSEDQKQQLHMQQEKDMAVQNENAIRGYAAIANAMYQVLRGMASEIDSKTPCMMAEIELPEEKYVLRNNVCFYQFMAIKKDTAVYEQTTLDEFCKTLQFTIHNKLHAGSFPSIVIEDYRDQYGNSYDGIVVDKVEDFGKYFLLSVVYISPEYAIYRHEREVAQMQRSPMEGNLSVTWQNKS